MTDIQTRWIEVADELESKKKGNPETEESVLGWMIRDQKDKFIKLALDSKKEELIMHQFDIQSVDDPQKELHDKLFTLADALLSVPASDHVTQTLLNKLADSLLNSFAL